MSQFAYLFIYQYTFGLFAPFGYSENGAIKVGVHTSLWELSVFTLKNYMIDIYSLGLGHDVFLFGLMFSSLKNGRKEDLFKFLARKTRRNPIV